MPGADSCLIRPDPPDQSQRPPKYAPVTMGPLLDGFAMLSS